jgi:hypothetical protein
MRSNSIKFCFSLVTFAARSMALIALLFMPIILAFPERACAAYTALYGSDGNDFYTFTGSSAVNGLTSSGWNGLILFATSVQSNGDITYSGNTLVSGGNYVGNANWGANVYALKTPPTTVYRYEVCIGGWGDASFTNIKNLIASQGTGSGSILYKNFQALKNAVPGIDAINYDDEEAYDVNSATSFGQMLNNLGYKVSLAPYMNQSYWTQLKSNLGSGCDIVYLQCYSGGAGNDPGSWDSAFGNGFHVMPGIESNSHDSGQADWLNWAIYAHSTGGFYWPDVQWAPGANWGASDIFNGIGVPNSYSYMCQVANLNSGLLLNAATPSNNDPVTGTQINQWYSVNDNQIWTLNCTVQNSNFWSSYWSLTYYTGTSETLSTESQAEGGYYQLYPWYNGGSQQFTLTPVSGWPGCYTITFMDGFVMDDQWGGTSIGTPVQEWVADDTNAQYWQLRFNPQTGY